MGTTKSFVQHNLPQIFKICSLCNRVNSGDGCWVRMEQIRIPSGIKISDGLCLECCEKNYKSLPEMKRFLLEKRK